MKYLGIPVSDIKLIEAQLSEPLDKIDKRPATWKCTQLSYGGERSFLTQV